jgi:hypothetical protein
MKSILSLLLCLWASWASAQVQPADTLKLPIDPETKRITYSAVVQEPGASQGELYARAKLWFAGAFKSAKDVVQADEKEAGVVQGTGWQDVYIKVILSPTASKLWYTVKLAVKDGRYKYDISEFRLQEYSSTYNLNPQPYAAEGILIEVKQFRKIRLQQRVQIDLAATQLVASIKASMSRPAAGTSAGKSDW